MILFSGMGLCFGKLFEWQRAHTNNPRGEDRVPFPVECTDADVYDDDDDDVGDVFIDLHLDVFPVLCTEH